MDDIEKVEKLLKIMQIRGVFRLRVGDIELEMMAATAVSPQITRDILEGIELPEDDDNVTFLQSEKHRLDKQLERQARREEEQEVYGAG